EKTQILEFLRPPRDGAPPRGDGGQRSFDLLGFTHFWGKSLKGNWTVTRKTMPARFARALKAVNAWCRVNRHEPLTVQREGLVRKLRGHYGYYGITGNGRSLSNFFHEVQRIW